MQSSHKPKLKGFEFVKLIGSGQFAEVWLAEKCTTKQIFAIKILDNEQIERQPKVKELMQSEVKILKTVKSPNVVKLYEHIFEKGQHLFVMEYCNGGDLAKIIKNRPGRTVPEPDVLEFLRQITNGFKALHKENAMHRDFKLANVLIHNGVFKIADLGFSKQADTAITPLGTSVYMAPEIMKYLRYNNKIDVWSLGVCLYEMLMGSTPFYGENTKDLLGEMMRNIINFEGGERVSEELKELIRRMLAPNPVRRINWSEIYAHPFITQGPPVQIDSRAVYMKNIMYYHAKILDDGYDLMDKHSGIYIYFLLSKRMLFISKEFSDLLRPNEEEEIYEMYFDYLLSDIFNYEIFRGPIYDLLKEEFHKDYKDVNSLLLIEIVLNFFCVEQSKIEKLIAQKKNDLAKSIAIHIIELIDIFNFKKSFEFNTDEPDGFDFERHASNMTDMTINELNELLSAKICNLF